MSIDGFKNIDPKISNLELVEKVWTSYLFVDAIH